jgi:hypothetical protein
MTSRMAKVSKSLPPRKPPEPKALHLTASMRVLRSHLHRPALVVEDAHQAVKQLALRLGTGESTADDLVLEEKLKKATGVSVAELARFAEDWPDDV